MKNRLTFFYFKSVLLLFFTLGCVTPVEPEFDFKEGLVFIDAIASTQPGASYVKILNSRVSRSTYFTDFIENADVTFRNLISGETVSLVQVEDNYIPPENFSVKVGETWELNIVLSDGTRYNSLSETVLEPVPIDDISATYNPKLLFRDNSEEFVPGHSISVSFNDPPNSDNYYYWKFTSFETLTLCAKCDNSVLRNDECVDIPVGIDESPYFTYICSDDCWRIRQNENIKIFSDQFVNGSQVNALQVADVLLYTKENILVEIEQISLSASAYEYFFILDNVVDNIGSFNAPPPAALIGNMFNPDDDQDYVLGRFIATGFSTKSIFINRSNINESMITDQLPLRFETSSIDDEVIITVECKESRIQTGIRPTNWIDN